MKKKILIGLAVVLIGLQFIKTDMTVPQADPETDFFVNQSEQGPVKDLIQTACYDCHSHQTEYPWYTAIQPVGMWTHGHVKEGRSNVNFSEWATYSVDDQKHILKECAEVVSEKEMPMLPYMMLHQNAWLSSDERAMLTDYFKSRATTL